MEKSVCRNILKERFLATMYDELMPGILHNFANPLSGIMGRSSLLQKRLDEHIGKITSLYPHVAQELEDDYARLARDVASINRDSEMFSALFWDVTTKFQSVAEEGKAEINISQLLAAEMRFTDFYLDFKHGVEKKLSLQEDSFAVTGSQSDYSLSFFALIYEAKRAMERVSVKEFFVFTESDQQSVTVRLRDSGEPIPQEKMQYINELTMENSDQAPPEFRDGLYYAALLLKNYGARIHVFRDADFNEIVVSIPR